MLAVLPERLEQAFYAHRAGDSDRFIFETGYVRDVIARRINAAIDLHASGQRGLVQRIGSFQRRAAIDHARFENYARDVLNFAREFGADAKPGGLGKLQDDFLVFSDVEIPGQVYRKT